MICEKIQKQIYARLPEILSCRNERTSKKDHSFVTKGDLLCQDIIVNLVRQLPEKFEIISEEIALDDFVYDSDKNYIVIDPIDGTENFTSGLKEWGISISIYKKGTHAESMIFLPELNVSLKTGDSVSRYASRIHGLSSSLKKEDLQNLASGFEYRITGCCVYNLYNVIVGSFMRFEHKGAYIWDVLAGFNLAFEHGLTVNVDGKKYGGEFLDPSRKYQFQVQYE